MEIRNNLKIASNLEEKALKKKMAESNKNNFNVELLTGSNYYTWKFRMNVLLEEKDVYEFIINEFKEDDYNDDKKREEARKKDNKCKSLIIQCLHDSQIEIVRDDKTAYGMWKSLKERYEKRGIPGQLMLRKKFMSMKLSDIFKLEEFLSEFDLVVRQLEASGVDLKEQDIVCTLLLAMPKNLETIVNIIESVPADNLTVDFVKSKLRAEVERRKSVNDNSDSYAKPAAFNNTIPNQGLCYTCGKRGHFKRDCRSNRGHRGVFQRGGQQGSVFRSYNRGFINNQRLGPRGVMRGSRGGFRGNGQGRQNFPDGQPDGQYAENEVQSDVQGGQNICFMTNQANKNETVSTDKLLFYIDSGCTDHLISDKSFFSDFMYLKNPINIAVAKNNNFMIATGVGNINMYSNVYGKEVKCTVKNVFYVPSLRRNLLSVKRLEMAGIRVVFADGQVCLYNNKILIGLGYRNNLYEISFRVQNVECLNTETENDVTKIWHKRLGHICYSNLEKLIKNKMVNGIENVKIGKVDFCESCVSGKMTRLKFGTRSKAKRVLEIVHSDVAGPITPTSHDNGKYFVTFIDDYSNFVIVYIIKAKSEVFDCFVDYVKMVQTKFSSKISVLRCDNGREYISGEIKNFCRTNGTFIDFTNPYTPEQNGKAERFNRSLVEKARAMIKEANLSKVFWSEAIRVAAYSLNRSPSNANENNLTPAELWNGSKPNIKNMRVFGCVAYVHIPTQFRNKFDEKSKKSIMIGYTTTGYRLWNVEEQKVFVSRDVVFNEQEYYFKRKLPEIDSDSDENENENNEEIEDQEQEEFIESDQRNENIIENNEYTRPKRERKLPRRLEDYEVNFNRMALLGEFCDTPTSYSDAKESTQWQYWNKAIEEELNALKEHNTWQLVKKEKDQEIISNRWVFKIKENEEGEKVYKARLVARGFEQYYLNDQIHAPVARLSTLRILLSICNKFDLFLVQLDVKNAFLNSEIKEKVFMKIPEGLQVSEKDKDKVILLNKAIYGLKQAPKAWNDRFNSFMVNLKFKRSKSDYCLYNYFDRSLKCYLLIYVDDILIACSDENFLNDLKTKLIKTFKMNKLSDQYNFLGIRIERDIKNKIITIDQTLAIEKIVKRFNVENCRNFKTPIEKNLNLKRNLDELLKTKLPYKELLGSLMYIMMGSRPDICFSVSYFSKFQDYATDEHFHHLLRVLKYLKSTINYKLYFSYSDEELICYTDADWANDSSDRKSVTGYCFKLFNGLISWSSKKQTIVTLSSTESEFVAVCAASCELIYIKNLLDELNISISIPISLYEDNQSTIKLLENFENNKRCKHIDVKFHFVVDLINNGIINVKYVCTNEQLADVFTKSLCYEKFSYFVKSLSIKE